MCCIPHNFSWSDIYYVLYRVVRTFHLTVTRTSLLLSRHSVSDRLASKPHMAHACYCDTQASNFGCSWFSASTTKKHTWFSKMLYDAFAKLRTLTTNLLVSVCPSVRMEKLSSILGGFSWNFIFEFFLKNLYRKFEFHKNRSRITNSLHEDQHIFIRLNALD